MAVDHPGADQQLLTRQMYQDDAHLAVRQRTHELYTIPQMDFTAWVLDRITWRGDERVLDIGAGPGIYFGPVKARIPRGQHFAADLSLGMIRRQQQHPHAAGSQLANLDVQHIPFAANTFDVVLANHMLYHVPDIDRALAEIKRVLKPGGVLVAATNSNKNMPELRTLYRRAILLLTNFKLKDVQATNTADRFGLEIAAPILARHFFAVARYDLPSALVFPEVQPVLDYLESTRPIGELQLPEGIAWEAYIGVIDQQVSRLIEHAGKLIVKKLSGVLVATDSGGFVQDYAEMIAHDRPRD